MDQKISFTMDQKILETSQKEHINKQLYIYIFVFLGQLGLINI